MESEEDDRRRMESERSDVRRLATEQPGNQDTETSKIRILLLVVRTRRSYRVFEEIGVCCLAAFLRRHGYEVMLAEEDEETLDYGRIQAVAPGLIGMPVYASTEEAVYRVCEEFKRRLPQTLLCLGGYSPSCRGPRMMRRSPAIDFIIRGEGELTLLELADRLSRGCTLDGVRGLIYRDGDSIRVNDERPQIQDPEVLPWPARDFLRDKRYPIALVATSRGCTRNCSFCTTRQIWKRWRSRDLRDAVDEIEYLSKVNGIRSFYFVDCSFEDPGPSTDRLRRLAEEIARRGLGITYSAFFRPDFHRKTDAALMDLLAASGLISALIGVESANPHGLSVFNKRTSPADNERVIELFRSRGFNVEIGFIMFHPYATFAGIRQDIDFLEKYGFASDLTAVTTSYAMSAGCALDRRIGADGLLVNEDDAYGYRFVDDRVGSMARYLRDFGDRLSPGSSAALLRVQRDIVNLAYWKRMLGGDPAVRAAIQEAERDYEEIREALNRNAAEWFRQLGRLAETGWDATKADAILAEHLSDRFIADCHRRLEQRKDSLRAHLARCGYEIQRMGSSGRPSDGA